MNLDDPAERTCSVTGLRLIPAKSRRGYRVSRDKYGGLSAQVRHVHPGAVGTANRFGVEFASRTLEGRCYAWWDRRNDDGIAPGPDDAHLVSSENVGITELFDVASRLGIPVLPGRRPV